MDNNGWIKIHRKLLEWEWADDPNMVALWIHLLLNANLTDKSTSIAIVGFVKCVCINLSFTRLKVVNNFDSTNGL